MHGAVLRCGFVPSILGRAASLRREAMRGNRVGTIDLDHLSFDQVCPCHDGRPASLLLCAPSSSRPCCLLLCLGEFTQEWEAYYRERNLWAKRILIVVAVDFLGVLLSSQATVAEFNTSVLHKLFVEDGLAMLLPATVFVAMIFPTIFSVVRPLRQPIA
jgi:hypothetical protein